MISEFFAGTYINLQDAYVVEANKLGTWMQVGYTGPGTSVGGSSTETGIFYYKESASAPQWNVSTRQKLNSCTVGDNKWQLTAKISGGEAEGQSNALYKVGGDATNCLALTPSFNGLVSGRSTN